MVRNMCYGRQAGAWGRRKVWDGPRETVPVPLSHWPNTNNNKVLSCSSAINAFFSREGLTVTTATTHLQ